MSGKYRDNVCVVIRRPSDSLVLLCHRNDCSLDSGWQFPQGGYSIALGLIPEMMRELCEEIGTDKVIVKTISNATYSYDLPPENPLAKKGYKGQAQKWVLCDFAGEDKDISFNYEPAEFDEFKWVSPKQALDNIIEFKKDVYRQALTDLGLLIQQS